MKVFLDTNILVYAQYSGSKGEIAKALLAEGGMISVQVLNELTNVLRKKLRRSWQDVEDVLADVMAALDPALPLTVQTHLSAFGIAKSSGVSFYDALIAASAIEAGCEVLYSEDMQHGRFFDRLEIVNPFAEL